MVNARMSKERACVVSPSRVRSQRRGTLSDERHGIALSVIPHLVHVMLYQPEAPSGRPLQVLRGGPIGNFRWIEPLSLVTDPDAELLPSQRNRHLHALGALHPAAVLDRTTRASLTAN